MTEEEMIDSLLSTNNQLREQIKLLEKNINFELNISKLALEGLRAIDEYGDSQVIASKTIQQIKDLENN